MPEDAAPPAGRWRFAHLLDAPHRVAFFGAAVVLAIAAAWWAVVVVAAAADIALPWALPSGLAHGLLLGFGFMPLFFAGFAFTAGPRWLRVPGPPARAIAPMVAAFVAGWLVFLLGSHLAADLAAAGLAASGLAFAALVLRFATLVARSRADDRLHPALIAAGCAVVALALLGAAAALAGERLPLARAALLAGLWGGLAVVHASALHRLVPVFGSIWPALDERRPAWLLALLLPLLALQGLAAALDAAGVAVEPSLRLALAMLEAALALLLFGVAWRWTRLQRVHALPFVAMLHTALLWLAAAFALGAAAHGLGAPPLAALHALTIGYMGSTFMAMVTRVTCGQGGRTLVADAPLRALFALLQLAALARVAAALWPQGWPLLPLAALAFAASTVGWALRYGRWYGRPRGG